jgi:broad specificity phosphatase PhoE
VHLRPGEAVAAGETTILFVRHAQGWHNKDELELANWHTDDVGKTLKYRDARLTPKGLLQARALNRRLNATAAQPPDVVVVSPLHRTIQTASLAFAAHPRRFVATELARERIAFHTCDWRSPRAALAAEYAHVDFGLVEHDDDVMWADAKEVLPTQQDSTACKQRGLDLLCWLRRRPEKRIAVVSHWVRLRRCREGTPCARKPDAARLTHSPLRSS